MHSQDETWMRRALELAERGRGYVEPNPLVGAVFVRDGKVVGEGWHERFGQAHAEINALARAGEAARGATVYVTLEPCCHQGKTPPCTDALLRAGVTRVVAALEDPFPAVAGHGAARLRAGGISVDVGCGAADARRQNAPYLKLLATGMPYVHVKWAMSLDGKIASKTGDSKWISGEESRRRVHELRGRMDAILIGIGTALADDPQLTARPPGPRRAARIVLDSRARLPAHSQLALTACDVPVLLVTCCRDEARLAPLRQAGVEIMIVGSNQSGRADLRELLTALGQRRWTNLLVEGGAEAIGSFLDLRAVDEAHVFVAPKLIGAAAAKSPIAGAGCADIAHALRLESMSWEGCGEDLYVHGFPAR